MNENTNRFPYTIGNVKTPSKKQISKVQNRSIKSFNPLRAYFTLLTMPPSVKPAYTYLGVVLRKFFLIQHLQKLHLINLPVRHVDHELDERVPFDDKYLQTYIKFPNIFLCPISMLSKRYGMYQAAKLGGEYLYYIKKAYTEAYRVYSYMLTTTYRPYSENKKIHAMRRADPHFLCVPSLHIAVVFLSCGFFDMLFEREGFSEDEKQRWSKEIYDEAIAIAESVLYVKQHSVNCIPAALYMMTRICPELFTQEYALNFIESLFRNASDVDPEDCQAIRDHIRFTYQKLMISGASDSDWTLCVKRWLDGYHSYEPFYAIPKKRRLYGKVVKYVRRKQFNNRRKYGS